MPNITLSIPHQLSREDAKKRVSELVAQVRQQFGNVGQVTESWNGNNLQFSINMMGMSVSGHIAVELQVVRVEIVLPPALAMLAGGMKQTIEQEAKKLLQRPK